jgi:hypothetical protein
MDIAPTITKWLNAQSDDDWRGAEIGSDAQFERSEVVTTVLHGSGVSIGIEALHILSVMIPEN